MDWEEFTTYIGKVNIVQIRFALNGDLTKYLSENYDILKLYCLLHNLYNYLQIDEGWWRGFCKGQYGLFPANYVILQ